MSQDPWGSHNFPLRSRKEGTKVGEWEEGRQIFNFREAVLEIQYIRWPGKPFGFWLQMAKNDRWMESCVSDVYF
jgi:hypothetical protein